MKLVETAGGNDGELPAADTCGMDDDDEDDVTFNDGSARASSNFFNKVKDKFGSNRMKVDKLLAAKLVKHLLYHYYTHQILYN